MTEDIGVDPGDKAINGAVANGSNIEPSKKADVVEIKKVRKKREKNEDVKRVVILRNVFDKVLGQSINYNWPDFPHDLFVFEDPLGTRLPISLIAGNVVTVLTEQSVTNLILQYSEKLILTHGPDLELRIHEAKEITARWLANANIIKHSQIAPVRFKSDPGYTWHRLDFDPIEGETPTFDEMFQRMDNAETVMAWIGSLFIEKASRQNYLWLHGSGGQGKSSLSKFLSELFGKSYKSEIVPDQSARRFWTSGLVGSRLVVFPDCNESFFVTTSLFKSLTGDDDIRIEYKNQQPMSIRMNCKFMFISNERPNISGSRADTRRIVYTEIMPLDSDTRLIPTRQYNKLLHDERAAFIYKCLAQYERVFTNHSDLSPDTVLKNESLRELIEDNENYLEEIFHEYFLLSTDYPENDPFITAKDLPQTSAREIAQLARLQKWNSKKINKFYEYILRLSPKIKRTRLKNGGRVIIGITPRTRDNVREDRNDF